MLIFTACGGKKSRPDPTSTETPPPLNSFDSPATALDARDLREAALEGQMEIVRKAVGQGVDVNAADEAGRTALMLASYNGHTPTVRYLLDEGARLSARNAEGRTPLIFAASGPFPETVKLLLERKADPDIRDSVENWSALMFAAAGGHAEVVQTLLDYGANASLQDKDGDTALDFARNNSHTEVVKLLESARSK